MGVEKNQPKMVSEQVVLVTDIDIRREDVESVSFASEAIEQFCAHIVGIFTLSVFSDYMNNEEIALDGCWITNVYHDVSAQEIDYRRKEEPYNMV